MRKHSILFALLAALWLLPGQAWSQETATIADGTDSNWYIPIYGSYTDYGEQTEIIYPATMLADLAGSTITQLKFFTSTSYANSTNAWNNAVFTIRMEEVSMTTTSSNAWRVSSSADTVYSGSVAIVNSVVTITLDEGFEYSGDNLAISINVAPCGSYYSAYFLGTNVNYNASAYAYNSSSGNNSVFSAPQTLMQFLPKIEITYEAGSGSANICRAPGNLSVSGITTDEATLSWTGRNSGESYVVSLDGEIIPGSTSDTSYTFYNLTPSSTHTIGVLAVCSAGDSSRMAAVTFRTDCAPITTLPYTMNFESSYTGSNTMFDPCWVKGQSNSSSYPYTTSISNNKVLYYYVSSPDFVYAIMPEIDESINITDLMLTFDQRMAYSSYASRIMVAMVDTTVITSLSSVDTIAILDVPNTAWVSQEVVFAGYTGTKRRIALIAAPNPSVSSYNYTYIDNVNLMVTPSCVRPQSITVSNVTAEDATLIINDPTHVGSYVVILRQDNTVLDSVNLSDTTYTFEDLDPTTDYTVAVYSLCSDGNPTTSVTATFTTPCGAITTLPWLEGFETYPTTYSQLDIPCWNYMAASSYSYTSSQYYVTTTAHNGSHSVIFTGYASTPLMMVLPSFSTPISTLELDLWVKCEGPSSGSLRVGYITNASDSTTFVPTAVFSSSDYPNSFVEEHVTFPGAPAGARIAIQQTQPGSSTNWYWWVDDLDLHVATGCARPLASASNVTSSEATVTINDPNNAGNYHVVVFSGNDTVYDAVGSDTSVHIDNLSPNTPYTIHVSAICADDEESNVVVINIRTACVMLTHSDLPFVEDFNSYSSGVANLPCWNRMSYCTSYPNYPTISNASGLSGSASNLLYFYNYNGPQYMVLPPVDYVSDLMLSFEGRSFSNGYNFSIGVMTDPSDPSTFVAMSTHSMSTEWDVYETTFESYEDTGHYVAIRYNHSYDYAGSYIDNVNLGLVPSCTRPTVQITSILDTAVVFNIVDANEVNSYQLVLAGTTDTVNITDNSYTLTGLTAATTYTVNVMTNCTDGTITRATAVTFTTECSLETFPWSCPQSSLYTIGNGNWNSCWSFTSNVWRATSNGILYVFTDAANTEFRLPAVDIADYSQTQFRAMAACTTANTQFRVGIMEGTTAVWIDTVTATVTSSVTDAVEYIVPLASYTGSGKRIVFGGIDNKSVYFQSFYVEQLDQCPPVSNLNVSNITENSAGLSWVSNGEESQWLIYLNGTLHDTATITNYSFTGLNAETQYSVGIAALCAAGDTARTAITSFRTPCGTITSLPWSEDFTSYPIESSYVPLELGCWTIVNHHYSSYYYPYLMNSNDHTTGSGNCLFIAGNSTSNTMLSLPPFADSLSTLKVNFWIKENNSGGKFIVGYCTDPNNVNTFVGVDTVTSDRINNSGLDYTEFEVAFPDEATGRIAFRPVYTSGYGHYLDDVTVSINNGCNRPASVAVTDVTTNTASIAITDPNEAGSYRVVWSNGVVSDTLDITSYTTTLTGLSASTNYSLAVSTLCENNATSNPVTSNFTTPCGTVNLPWSENFNNVSGDISNMNCWNIYSGLMSEVLAGTTSLEDATAFWALQTTGGNGTKHPRVNVYYDNRKHWLVTPALLLDADAELSVLVAANAYNSVNAYTNFDADDRAAILISNNAGTWTRLVSWGTQADDTAAFTALSSTGTTYTINLSAFTGEQVRIAFYCESTVSGSDWDFSIDDIVIDYLDTTYVPTTYTVSAASADATMGSATVSPSGTVDAGTSVTFTATANS
ncbi:MAG: hypothetical protein IJ745_04910, partial [Bacteroidales bacterium]|nr:hypothetical protein [Bacteroidales bacterium]